jgi:hypothetical protein
VAHQLECESAAKTIFLFCVRFAFRKTACARAELLDAPNPGKKTGSSAFYGFGSNGTIDALHRPERDFTHHSKEGS